MGNSGVNQLFKNDNIPKACADLCIPIICRYEPDKNPAIKNYFTDLQQNRYNDLISNAKNISIIGVQCNYKNDSHIWGALEKTPAHITYFEPFNGPIDVFRSWASKCGKKETENYDIVQIDFKKGLHELCNTVGL